MRLAILLSVLLTAPHAAAAWPPVTAIHFVGNDTTRESVLLREMVVAVGDPADPERIAASRQAMFDLGLFRVVDIHQETDGDGVALTVRVSEKRYLLPIPRVSGSSDGDRGYGAQLRWNNISGLNHDLDVRIKYGEHSGDRLRERETIAHASYDAPYVFNERDGLITFIEYLDRVAPGADGSFDERIRRTDVAMTRDYRGTRPRRGWIGKAGLSWVSQDTSGEFAPPSDGDTVALLLGADFDDVRYNLYSETGQRFSSRFEIAREGVLSDFSFWRLEVRYIEHIALASPHHSLHLIAEGGLAGGGTDRRNTFGLGGSDRMRGYKLDFIEGERFGYVAAEYLRPVFGQDWVRLLVLGEAGWTGGSAIAVAPAGGPFTSVGVGLRIRISWFVNAEVDLGVAYPLRGGDGLETFSGSN